MVTSSLSTNGGAERAMTHGIWLREGQIAMNWVKTLFSELASYIKRSASETYRWFRVGDTFWIWLAATFIILVAFYLLPYQLPDRVHWAGTLFEFMGVISVVISINRARFLFGKPSVLRGMWIWLGDFRFIFFHRPPINLSANLLEGAAAMAGVGTVVVSTSKTTEERIAQLEKQVSELQANFGTLDQKVDQQKQELRAEIDREASARQAGDQGIGKKVEEGMIGDSALEVAGIVYVCLGLIMAHLSDEVAQVLSWFGLT
jgi:outer membrane murein-binding lipoprotein Lpp